MARVRMRRSWGGLGDGKGDERGHTKGLMVFIALCMGEVTTSTLCRVRGGEREVETWRSSVRVASVGDS